MYTHYYFIGIGGIGMSAIARYFKHKGFAVSGYDRTPSALTRELENEGIRVHYDDDVEMVPKDVEHTFVIWTPAIPAEMSELQYVRSHPFCRRHPPNLRPHPLVPLALLQALFAFGR